MADALEVRVAHLTGEYGGRLVQEISFQMARGQRLAVLGPAGAGKTALLALLAGLPSARGTGEIRLADERIDALPAWKRRAALIPADLALWPNRTVADHLRFVNSDPASWQPWLARLGLEPLLLRLPIDLTPAERLRVAWARTLLASPRLLLLDDPLGPWRNGPLDEWWGITSELKRWMEAAHPVPIVLATSSWQEAARLGDQVLLLAGGRLLACGDPAQLYAEPGSVAAARASSPWPINLLPATLSLPPGPTGQPGGGSQGDRPGSETLNAPDQAKLAEGAWVLPLRPAAQQAIATWWSGSGQKQRSVLVGLRPEQIRLLQSPPSLSPLSSQLTTEESKPPKQSETAERPEIRGQWQATERLADTTGQPAATAQRKTTQQSEATGQPTEATEQSEAAGQPETTEQSGTAATPGCCWPARVVAVETWGWANWVGLSSRPHASLPAHASALSPSSSSPSSPLSPVFPGLPVLWVLMPPSTQVAIDAACHVCLPDNVCERPLLFDPATERQLPLRSPP